MIAKTGEYCPEEGSVNGVVRFRKSIKQTYNEVHLFRARSCSRRITNIILVVKRFGRKPFCSSGRIPTRSQYSLRRRAMIFSSILPACTISEIPFSLPHSVRSFLLWSTMMMAYFYCCGNPTPSKYKRRYGAVSSTSWADLLTACSRATRECLLRCSGRASGTWC